MEFDILSIFFPKSVEKIQLPLIFDKHNE